MKRYVLGFAFDDENSVLLVQKTKPQWQAGKLNGIGGGIEDHDPTDKHAMSREFLEETGHYTPTSMWDYIITMTGSDWQVEVFTLNRKLSNIWNFDGRQTDTDEILKVLNIQRHFLR